MANIIKCLSIAILILIGVDIPYINYLAVLLACYFISKGTVGEVVEILIFTLALSPIFKLDPGANTFSNILIVAAIIKILFSKPDLVIEFKEVTILWVFAFYVLLSSGPDTIMNSIKFIMYLVLMLLVFKQNERLNLRSLILFFSVGIILTSFAGLFNEYIPGLTSFIQQASLKLGDGDYINRFSGIRPNPNHYTMDISIALAGLFVFVINRKAKLLDYILIVALSVFGLMSISKSFLLIYSILIILILLINLREENPINVIKVIFVMAVLASITYVFVDKDYINAYLIRLLSDNSEGQTLSAITTGRTDIWNDYLIYIFHDIDVLLFGKGLGADYFNISSHNFYIEGIYYLGIVGFTLYWAFMKNLFLKQDLAFKRRFINYLPLIILLIRGMGINLILSENLIFYYIIVATTINTELVTEESQIILNPEEAKTI